METLYHYHLTSSSGYKFKSIYSIKSVYTTDGTRRNITGTLYVGYPKTGDRNEACTTITVNYPESIIDFEEKYQRPSNIDPSVASLILTKHYSKCAENRDLIKGEGTVEMITSAMSFIKQICPFIREFDLNDASSKECDNHSPITLPYFYITNKGKTWYESKFGAYLKPSSLYDEYRTTIMEVMNMPLESYDVFAIRYLSKVLVEVKDAIQEAYEPSRTVGEFFKRLYKKHSINMVCMLLQGWIDDYMRTMRLEPYIARQKWYISVETIPMYKFKNLNHTLRVKRIKENKTMKRRNVWNADV
jgi:hypothetical protein